METDARQEGTRQSRVCAVTGARCRRDQSTSTYARSTPTIASLSTRQTPQHYNRDASLSCLHATKTKQEETVVVQRPDPSILLSAQSDTVQRIGFVAIVGALAVGTYAVVQGLTVLEHVLPAGWFDAWRYYTWTLPNGLLFFAAGVTHFTISDTFTSFVPPPGTWGGLWRVPAPGADKLGLTYEQYHTYWTGIAEMGGGALLLLAGFPFDKLPVQLPAFLLFLLTMAVTPANIYMFTHDVQPPRLPPVPYPEGHIARGVMQCLLLAIFWKLAFQ